VTNDKQKDRRLALMAVPVPVPVSHSVLSVLSGQ
jgi:hypothetical protein